MASSNFKPALIVVDMQEDFCPPHGNLQVPEGRAVVPLINTLLALPTFTLRVGTQDWHPPSHISFASNHPGKQPFVDTCIVTNPYNPDESYTTRLWPNHCIQESPGAELVPELDVGRIDKIIKKGTDARVEMYSAFYDPLKNPRVSDSGLSEVLKEAGITHVYVVGLAADYCVKSTAVDAVTEGFVAYLIEDGTRAVDAVGWTAVKLELKLAGVNVVSKDDVEVRRLFGEGEDS
ncbi:hypothetical protein OQA88_11978 [Cercophora sp. LCS_1]